MTISSTNRSAGPFLGNGTLVSLPFNFTVFQAADVVVQRTSTTGVQSVLVLGVGYTVSVNQDQDVAPGGSVTLTAPLATGEQAFLTSGVTPTQPLQLRNGGPFLAKSIERALDRLTILFQQLGLVGIVQSLRVPEIGGLPVLPAAEARANRVLAFDSAGNPLVIPGVDSGSALALALDLADTSSASKGAGQVGYSAALNYAAGTLGAKMREVSTITDALPLGFNAAADDATAYIQAAWNSGAKVIDMRGIPLKCDTVTMPAGLRVFGADLTRYSNTAGNLVQVNTGCSLQGRLAGTGLTSAVQRGVYPAAPGVKDVQLDLDVSGFTYGVHAAPVAAASSLTYPRRWSGKIYAHDIVGTPGVSEGYGVLLESAQSCTFDLKAVNIRRHAIYLSAGACDNVIEADIDGCGNYAAQVNTLTPQEASQRNRLTVRARNLTTDSAGQSGALAVLGRSHYNVFEVYCEGNPTTLEAVRIEGSSAGVQTDHPLGNAIVNGMITGMFSGGDVIRMINADSTVISGNIISAAGTVSVIAMRRTGTNLSKHGGYIGDNMIDAMGSAAQGIYNEINTAPSYIGPNEIRNNGGAARVNDQSGGHRSGYSRRITFSGTTASIGAATVGDTTVTFPLSGEVAVSGRRAGVYLTSASVSFTSPHAVIRVSHPSATTLAFRLYNASGSAQTYDFEGWVEGD